MGCNCGKPKCDGHCGVSPAVLQINNPSECVLFHRVEVPASMGDSITNPPKPGAYRNTLLYYKADGEAFLYSSDGIPTKITGVANDYACLENKPQINGVTLEGNKSLADIGVTDAINNALQPYTPRSELAEVAFSGSYNDLTDKPDIPSGSHVFYMLNPSVGNAAPIYHDYRRTDQVTLAQFTDAIASGPVQIYIPYDSNTFRIHYVDQMDAFIPDPPMVTGTLYVSFGLRDQYGLGVRRFLWYEPDTAPIFDGYDPNQSDWNQASPTDSSYIKNKPNLATVATSGSYNDLSNKPTIPAAQVNSDWNAASGVAQILNKPSLATVATSGSYNDLTDKPTIPTVNNATLTIQKNGANVQTFTANQSTNATANITVPTKTSDLTNDGATGTSAYIEESDIAPSELSGEGEFVTLEGTTDCSALDTQLNGNAEQATYSGKNLLNINGTPTTAHATRSISGQSITVTTDNQATTARVTLPIEYEANREMTISFDATCLIYEPTETNTVTVYMRTTGQADPTTPISLNKIVGTTVHYTETFTPNNDTKDFWLYLKSAPVAGVASYRFDNIQVEYGASETSYEPYTGGSPMPNPDFPSAVNVVSGAQTVQVTGKNLVEDTISGSSIDGNGIIRSNSDFDTQVAFVIEGETYTLSYTGGTVVGGYFATKPTINSASIDGTRIVNNKTFVAQYTGYFTFRTNAGESNAQCELGSTATAYEPYQGQEFEVNLGKNLTSLTGQSNITWGNTNNNFKNFLNTLGVGTYTFSCKFTLTSRDDQTDASKYGFFFAYGGGNIIDRPEWGNVPVGTTKDYSLTFTITEAQVGTFTNVYLYGCGIAGATGSADASEFQVERGSSATSYAPYFTPIELAKIGNYQDRIYKTDGKWYIEKQVGKVVLNGSETIEPIGSNQCYRFVVPGAFIVSNITALSPVMSDYYTSETPSDVYYGRVEYGVSLDNTSSKIRIHNKDCADKTALATWLSTHPTTVYYALATPTTTEITDETLIRQLEALAGALGYDGVTNIMSASPVLPAILSVSTYTGSAIPPATRARAGIVRIGDGIEVDDCGTISVNAQKAPTAFTMQYADNLAGWQSGDNYELVKETTGSPTDYIYRANKFYYGGADVSFLNEKTGVVFTPQELYAWLLDGNEAVLNHVPLGWAVDNGAEVLYAGNYIDGIWLKKETIASQSGNTISFNGSAFVTAFIPRTSSYEERAQDTLGIAISGYEDDGAMVYDLISIDGFSLYGSVQESSPII